MNNKSSFDYNNEEKYVEKEISFFEQSILFDNNLRKKIEKKSGLEFDVLVEWCAHQCYNRPKNIDYIGKKQYVHFFLFSVFRHKDALEKFYSKTKSFFDKSFSKRLVDNEKQYQGYLWELFLKYFYLMDERKIQESKNNNGPDIFIKENDNNIYIECVAPEVGNTDFKVPEMKWNCVSKLPIPELKKRLKIVVKSKADKYIEYFKNSNMSINKKDKLYIAVNTGNLSNYSDLMDYNGPLIIECLKEMNFFKEFSFIDGVIYNHKSIFEYNDEFKLIIVNKDYTYYEQYDHVNFSFN